MTVNSGSQKAVVFTDLVSSTAATKIVGGDQASFAMILHFCLSFIRKAHPQFAGADIKTTSDGSIVVFEDIESAVLFSMRLQDYFLSDQFAPYLSAVGRVGIHYGDTALSWDEDWIDVTGTAVDYASRICAVANAGQILVSQYVANLLDPSRYKLAEWPGYILNEIDGVHSVFQVLWGTSETRQPEGTHSLLFIFTRSRQVGNH